MLSDLIENFRIKQTKTIKINNPVDFDFIQQKLNISEKISSFDNEHKHIVSIGNLSKRKGFDNLLNVFSYLKNENIKLHILGDGKDKDLLLSQKEKLGLDNVIFHGRQENPYLFLKFADLFILSSRYEGFPNVLLEAGACGIYSIANDCPGGIREIIQPNINGEIHRIENHQEFAEKIKNSLNINHQKELIINSIKSRFSKEIILKQYQDVFQD